MAHKYQEGNIFFTATEQNLDEIADMFHKKGIERIAGTVKKNYEEKEEVLKQFYNNLEENYVVLITGHKSFSEEAYRCSLRVQRNGDRYDAQEEPILRVLHSSGYEASRKEAKEALI